MLRGAFGLTSRRIACVPDCSSPLHCEHPDSCVHARLFEPSHRSGPSGLLTRPRPFIFRASHLDGVTVSPGQAFHFDVNVFDTRDPALSHFVTVFQQVAHMGLGASGGQAVLDSVWQMDSSRRQTSTVYDGNVLKPPDRALELSLAPEIYEISRVIVDFLTPTELKSAGGKAREPDFPTLFARARDRVSTLRGFYGAGFPDLDFRGLGDRAARVRLTTFQGRHVNVNRRSSRTGQVHGLGGFIGTAEYEGSLSEFIPFLRAAEWTGVGRQTVWGKGEIRLRFSPALPRADEDCLLQR